MLWALLNKLISNILILSMKNIQPLNENDIILIKKNIKQNYKSTILAAFICLTMTSLLYLFSKQSSLSNWHIKHIHIYFFTMSIILITLTSKLINNKYYLDLSSNKKHNKICVVTNKSDKEHIKRVGNTFTEVPYLKEYYLFSNKEKYTVNKELYSDTNLQDKICISHSSNSKTILNISKYETERK